MNATETTLGPDHDGYLGNFSLVRFRKDGQISHPIETLHVTMYRGCPRYTDVSGSRIILKPTDRNRSQAVMEDDTPERQEALRAALKRDRWKSVTVRG